MKNQLPARFALVAFIVATTFLTACGGGGGGGGGTPAPAVQQDSRVNAPETLVGKSYTIRSGTAPTRVIAFGANNQYTITPTSGAQENGSFSASSNGDRYTVQTSSSGGTLRTFSLQFTGSGNGSYSLTEGANTESGTFEATSPASTGGGTTGTGSGSTDGSVTGGTSATGTTSSTSTGTSSGSGTGSTSGSATGTSSGTTSGTTSGTASSGSTGTTSGSTDGGTSGSTSSTGTTGSTSGSTSGTTTYNGFVPSSLVGREVAMTRAQASNGGGQTHYFTFTATTFRDVDNDEIADGTYQYTPESGTRARLVLTYTMPTDFNGDHADIQLTFTARDSGTYVNTYTRNDGAVITINGPFVVN